MLTIITTLRPFFEDNYRRISVREYARLMKISPPFASKRLKEYEKEELLEKEKEGQFIYFVAKKTSTLFVGMQRMYYYQRLKKIGVLDYLEQTLVNPVIILFGSLAKGETQERSDIDLAIFSISKKRLDLREYETKLGREIQLFLFKDRKNAEKQKELYNNILNGAILSGCW